tara:strand:+ start:4044 stop:4853 length:810 start_codon:yes stop_codon:yes gene_type:complete
VKFRAALFACLFSFTIRADQPIFNEMPRWSDGWGFQWVYEHRYDPHLLTDGEIVGRDFEEDVHILHLEGVYTWKRWIRMTAKIPYVLDARREIFGQAGEKLVQHDEGLGDILLALPLKKYFNLDGRSGSWTVAPQVNIPMPRNDAYAIFDNNWGNALSLGYETETYKWHFGAGVTGFLFYEGDEAELHANLDLGRNIQGFGSAGHIKWETDLMAEDDGTLTILSGPAFHWKITDTVHARMDWKRDWFDRQGGLDHGRGDTFRIGIGFVF